MSGRVAGKRVAAQPLRGAAMAGRWGQTPPGLHGGRLPPRPATPRGHRAGPPQVPGRW